MKRLYVHAYGFLAVQCGLSRLLPWSIYKRLSDLYWHYSCELLGVRP